MGEPNAIDRTYDALETFVSGVGSLMGIDVNKPDDADDAGKVSALRSSNVTQLPAPAVRALPAAPAAVETSSVSVARPRPFEVLEIPGIGVVVTNGTQTMRAPSRAHADLVLVALRAKGAITR